jgi:hypothetical protein
MGSKVVYIYMATRPPGPTLSFLSWYLQQNNNYFLVQLLCDLHTTTEVGYSLTIVFLQFLNCHLVTPHPKTPRLPSLQSQVAFVDKLG